MNDIEIVSYASKRLSKKSLVRKPRKVSTKKPKALKKPKWRFKKSELRNLDDHFSLMIRNRDKRCQFPACSVVEIAQLQCSHYEGRARWETRFDEANCIALCWYHHYKSKLLGYEYQKQRIELHGFDGQYTKHMKDFLGETAFLALINKPKQSRKEVMELYRTLQSYTHRK